MVRQYYVDAVTALSEQELRPVCRVVEPPVCLLGGWAVHLHVNDGFQAEHGRGYIGSRDIDLGVHVNPAWDADTLPETAVGRSVAAVREAGYDAVGFRFVRYFDRETGDSITADDAEALPQHRVFQLFLDIIPDTTDLDTFHEVFGFRPPAEPLLRHAFDDDAAAPLTAYRSWDVPDAVQVAAPDLVAAMKLRSIPDRDRAQKRVKDVADLHALLWYVTEYAAMQDRVLQWVSAGDLDVVDALLDPQDYAAAADLLQINQDLVQDSIEQLFVAGPS